MNDEIKTLFQQVAGLSASEREVFFREKNVSADDRGEVESLLAFDDGTTDSIEVVVRSVAEQLSNSEPAAALNERFGAYRLIGLIGKGGMGDVFLAERADGEVEQKV